MSESTHGGGGSPNAFVPPAPDAVVTIPLEIAVNPVDGQRIDMRGAAFSQPERHLPRFGPPGRMKPEPRMISNQPPDWMSYVPDSVVEWADLDGLSVRGVSVRGHGHRYEGSVRQDQLAIGAADGVLVGAVGDGVGSQDASHLGSALVTRIAVTRPDIVQLACENDPPEILDCSSLSEILSQEARNRGLNPNQVSTTLTFVAMRTIPAVDSNGVTRWRIVLGQIGDSNVYILRRKTWKRISFGEETEPSENFATNVVSPLPSYSQARLHHLMLMPGDVLALTTDGVGDILEDQKEYADALADLWSEGSPLPSSLLQVIDGGVKSYDDDRTILAISCEAQS